MRNFYSFVRLALITAVFSLLSVSPALTEVVEESGSLVGFLCGSCPGAAYDNWISHTSEGEADAGYNDYGPAGLDPQNDDFGDYRMIPDDLGGLDLLDSWRDVFYAYMRGDMDYVDNVFSDSLNSWFYEAVHFEDTETDREFYILREQLDDSYVDDSNTPGDESDDVVGSFNNGWGVYVFNPEASRPNVLVQVVHPNDDFLASIAAVELFMRLDAGSLAIHGAGRSVVWNEDGNYSNADSYSDPSRTGLAPLLVHQNVFADSMNQTYPVGPMVFQVHSCDVTHDDINPIVLSAGQYVEEINKPVRDITDEHKDIIHFTPEVAVPANLIGTHDQVLAYQYYWVNYPISDPFYYYDPEGVSHTIPRATKLRGNPTNYFESAMHNFTYRHDCAIENFYHVELHEFPVVLQDGSASFNDLFGDERPPVYETYAPILSFYDSYHQAIEDWFIDLEGDDPTPPDQPMAFQLLNSDQNSVTFQWMSTIDGNHASYEIIADSIALTDDSPVVWDWSNDYRMKGMGFAGPVVTNTIEPGHDWQIAVRIKDFAGNNGEMSNVVNFQYTIPPDTVGVLAMPGVFDTYPLSAWPAWCSFGLDDVEDLNSVALEWMGPDSVISWISCEQVNDLFWGVSFGRDELVNQLNAGDTIKWRIHTSDISSTGNPLVFPEEDWYEFELVAGSPDPFHDGFENDISQFTCIGAWEIGTAGSEPNSAFSGGRIAGIDLDGNYGNRDHSRLVSDQIDLRGYPPQKLLCFLWYDYQVGMPQPGLTTDGCYVSLQLYDGEEVILEPVDGYPYTINAPTNPGYGFPAFSGESDGWVPFIADLTQAFGYNDVIITFHSVSDLTSTASGLSVDEISITKEVNLNEPEEFSLLSPANNTQLSEINATFTWESCIDPDYGAMPEYSIVFYESDQRDTVYVGHDTTAYVEFESLNISLYEYGNLNWYVHCVSQGDEINSLEEFNLESPPFNAVEGEENNLPKQFALGKLYPNPFNSILRIEYEVPHTSEIQIEIFDILGRQVQTLLNANSSAGYHSVSWNAAKQASGIYFVRFSAQNINQTKKILLVK